MRALIGLVVSTYFLGALVVGGGGLYGFLTDQPTRDYSCPPIELAITAGVADGLEGEPDWLPWVAVRAALWPIRYWQEREVVPDPVDWVLVRYDPFPNACR